MHTREIIHRADEFIDLPGLRRGQHQLVQAEARDHELSQGTEIEVGTRQGQHVVECGS